MQGKDAAVLSGRLQNASRLMSLLQDFGDNALLMAGLHEFMDSSGYSDISMQRTATMQGYLQDADLFARAAMRTGDYGLHKYVPASILSLATMLAVPHRCDQTLLHADRWTDGQSPASRCMRLHKYCQDVAQTSLSDAGACDRTIISMPLWMLNTHST